MPAAGRSVGFEFCNPLGSRALSASDQFARREAENTRTTLRFER
jgi:hypothetical protein